MIFSQPAGVFKIFLVILLVSLINVALPGMDKDPLFFSLTREDGLADNSVKAILKDSDGFMWFGTRNGLCRYDGMEFLVFRTEINGNSVPGNRILTLAEDAEGYLWIGTHANGLCRLDRTNNSFKRYGSGYGFGSRINRIASLNDGSVWICTNTCLAKYLPALDSFLLFTHDPSVPGSINYPSVFDIIRTTDGKIFVATEARNIQLLNETEGTFQDVIYKRDSELNVNYNKRIVEGPDGLLYISANYHGLVTLDPATGESRIFVEGAGQLTTNVLSGDMAFGPDGNLWICTDGAGINVYDPQTGKFNAVTHSEDDPRSLASDHVYTVYFDEENRLWTGTFDRGVSVYDRNRFKFTSSLFQTNDLEILHNKSVIALFQDSRFNVWAGTDGNGLFRFDQEGAVHVYRHDPDNKNSLSTDVITSLGEDNNGNILIGTYMGGLISFNPSRGIFTRLSPSSSSVWKILKDSQSRIWLGLLGEGLDLYDPVMRTFENYGPASNQLNRIDFQNVMEIFEDSDGDIWFGTEGVGIFILDNQTKKVLRPDWGKDNLVFESLNVKAIFQDWSGGIWIGSEGRGLIQYHKTSKEATVYTQADGFPGNIIQSINEDRYHNLWIGTNNGLAFFNRSNDNIINFFTQDGLKGTEFNQGTMLQLTDGRILTGTKTGADLISATEINLNQNLPRVILTGLKILNKVIEAGDTINGRVVLQKEITFSPEIKLKYSDKNFSLRFAALNYTLPEKCRYRYQLEGFDQDWIEVSSGRREASYSNLKPGKYVFRVLASNNDGRWGNNVETLQIHVSAPFYRTEWFLIFTGLVFLSILYSIYRIRLQFYRNSFLQKQNEQQRRIMELEKEKLEKDLQTLSLQRIHRNRILLNQKNRLLGLSLKAKESVKQGLDKIISEIDEDLLDERDWTFIEPQLDKVYNNFISKLREKHEDLTQPEIKLAAYVRMGLGTKEISEFMQKTTRGIESDRYRLRKKLGLDQNDSLSQYLLNL